MLEYKHFQIEDPYRTPDSSTSLIIVLVVIILGAVGFIGNLISITVFATRIHRSRNTSHMFEYLFILQAFVDIFCVSIYSSDTVLRMGFGLDVAISITSLCKLFSTTFCITYSTSTAIVIAMTIAQHLAHFKPTTFGRLFTKVNLLSMIGLIVLPITVFCGYLMVKQKSVFKNNNGTVIQYCGTNPPTKLFLSFVIVFIVFYIFGPAIFVFIIYRRSKAQREKMHLLKFRQLHGPSKSNIFQNSFISSLGLGHGFPASLVFTAYFVMDFKEHVRSSALDAGLMLSILPKALSFLVLFFFCPPFHRQFRRMFRSKDGSVTNSGKERNDGSRQQLNIPKTLFSKPAGTDTGSWSSDDSKYKWSSDRKQE